MLPKKLIRTKRKICLNFMFIAHIHTHSVLSNVYVMRNAIKKKSNARYVLKDEQRGFFLFHNFPSYKMNQMLAAQTHN